MGFSVIVLECVLVSRLSAASEPFGTDALMYFHRLMGIAAVGFLVAHPVLLAGSGVTPASFNALGGTMAQRVGPIAFWVVVLMVISSIWRRRLRLRYEVWRGLHTVSALVIVPASVAHIVTVRGYSQVPAVAGACLVYGGLFAVMMLGYRVVRPLRLWPRPWRVVENRDEGGDTRTLALQGPAGTSFRFMPGQFAWLTTGSSPFSLQQHPMTISSSAEEPGRLEFSIKALGDWSRSVPPALEPGARVWVDGPYGVFSPDREPGQGFVLIAGGIGVTPMRSMLRTMRDRGDPRPVVLIFAASNWQRVMFRSELATLERQMNLKVVYVFADPPEEWTGERGLVTHDLLARHLPVRLAHYQYFVCGPPPMMDSVEETLAAVGVPADHIHSERFDLV